MTDGQKRLWKQIRQAQDSLAEEELWAEIHKEAETNEALREALDKVKVIYFLSKENKNGR